MCCCRNTNICCRDKKTMEQATTNCLGCFSRAKEKRKNFEVIVCMRSDMLRNSNQQEKEISCLKNLQMTEILGSGGFGSVYEGCFNGRKVAVKRIHVRTRNSFAVVESIEAEAHGLSLSHPNIVQTLAVIRGKTISDTFIVMEFAGKRNLQTLVDDEMEQFSELRRTKFATHIAQGLEYIHAHNLVHLDIKPANIIVDSQDNCKIGDFGCSQTVDFTEDNFPDCLPPSPTPSYLTGTFAYRAPELLKGETATTKADIYSLGICLWQMLTREQPYGLQSQFVVIFGVVAYHLRPSVPANMTKTLYTELMHKLWDPSPELRPSAKNIVKVFKERKFT